MKKLLTVLLAVVMLTAAVSAFAEGTLRVGMECGYAPYNWQQVNETEFTAVIADNNGYADGYDRHYGNGRGRMWVAGTLCPTVGNVCMDAVMIDITDAPESVKVGDEVEVFGEHVPIEELAAVRDTIPYEVLTSVSPRVRRVYVNE